MKIANGIIDRLQATFPPNRIMLILAGPIVAAAAWLSGLVTANIPGLELPVGIIGGVIGAAVLIVVTLIYKWFDRWQEGERIDYEADVAAALDDLMDTPEIEAFYKALGTLQGTGDSLADLRARIAAGSINEAETATALEHIGGVLEQFLAEHTDAPPESEVASPAPAAPPTAAE